MNETFEVFKDGNQWCCVRPGFTDLMECLAGFGDDRPAALADLLRQEEAADAHE